jgi:hypothetical protein
LRGEMSFLLGPARYLGHYVVGRLASELGVAVQLANSPVTGVTARLVLPPSVVSASAEQSPPELPGDPAQPEFIRPSSLLPRQREPVVALARAVEPRRESPPALGIRADTTHAPIIGPDRTRNGLIKRNRRSQPRIRPQESTPRTDAVAIDRQPTDVRAMLSAFRTGIQRGENHPEPSASRTASGSNPESGSTASSGGTTSPHERGSQ